MTLSLTLEDALFLLVVLALVRPIGAYLMRVFGGHRTVLDPALVPVERLIYRVARVDARREMDWREYALAFVLFGVAGTALLFVILVAQPLYPWNNHASLTTPMTPDLALNTAVSFSTTTMANNGQVFAGLSANSPFYNLTTIVTMLAGRFGLGVLALALAGIVATQRRRPATLGTLPTDSLQFGVVIIGTAILVGALTFLPAYALGPIVEHLQMVAGR